MAEYNQNKENPDYNSYSDRDRNSSRNRDQSSYRNRENDYGFGNTSSKNSNEDYMGRGYSNRTNNRSNITGNDQQYDQNYNRVNYLPDNDDNQKYDQQDFSNSNYGSSGNYGYRGEFGQDFQSRNEHTGNNRQMFGNNNTGNYNNKNQFSNQYGNTGYNNSNLQHQNRYDNLNRSNYRSQDQGWQNSGMNNDDYSGNYGRMNVYSTDHDNYSQSHQGQQYNRPYNSNHDYFEGGSHHVNRNFSGEDYPYPGNQMNRNTNYGNQRRDRNWWERTKEKVSSWFDDNDDDRNRRYDPSYSHRGKGPKGYARSADRIREDVCDRLTDDDRVDASGIHIDIQGRDVILTGTVHSREEKRRAEDLVESISGVDNVENRLRIDRGTDRGHDYTGTTDKLGGIGTESGTTNEIIRNTGNKRKDL